MTENSKLSQFLQGLKAGIPIILGFIPVGIAYAVMARQAGLTVLETSMMSLTVFAGASQMMAAGMYGEGAMMAAIIITTLILNLRHVIMSTCVFNKMNEKSIGKKLFAAFGVTDETFAVFTTEKSSSWAYFIGLVTAAYSSWNAGTLLGAFLSDFLPEVLSASLSVALYAMFIGLLVPNLTKNLRLLALVVLTAICNSVLSSFMISSWALVFSTLLCAAIGVFFVEPEEDTKDER